MRFNYWQNIEEGQTCHIYNKAISEIKLFRDKVDYLYFLSKYEQYFQQYQRLLCYILHIHHNPIHHGLTQEYIEWKYSL